MRNDRDVVLAEVNQEVLEEDAVEDYYALENASYAMRNDREVFLTAVNQDARALQYVSFEMKNDEEVV